MPISSTQISCSRVRRKRVRGRPSSLLKFPSVFSTRYFCPSTEATMSLVVVLPTLPVMPITGMGNLAL